jgi:hypothetical protein
LVMVAGASTRLRTTTVSSHAACPRQIVALDAALLDELLRHCVAGAEEDGRRQRLGDERRALELRLVPDGLSVVAAWQR